MRISLFLVILLNLVFVQSRLRPCRRRAYSSRSTPFVMPAEYMKKSNWDLLIPNQIFCERMSLQPGEQYLVQPWWYHYCQNYIEKRMPKYDRANVNLSIFRSIVDKVQEYKKNHRIGK